MGEKTSTKPFSVTLQAIVSHWVPTVSYHFGASHIHRLSVAQATAGDISAPLNSIVWLKEMPVSHYSFVSQTIPLFPWEQERLYIPYSSVRVFRDLQLFLDVRLQIHYRREVLRQLDKHKKRHRHDNAPLSLHIIFPVSISPPNTFSWQAVLYFALSMTCWDRNVFEC